MYIASPKGLNSQINISVDWSDWLSTGSAISSSTWTADSGLTVDPSGTEVNGLTTTAVSGGSNGFYVARNTIVADNGETDTREILIPVGAVRSIPTPVTFYSMLYRLTLQIPYAVPTGQCPPIYEQAVYDGVAQFSQDSPQRRRTSISVVSGTEEYNLPSDFLSLLQVLPLPTVAGGVYISDGGLVPVSSGWYEEFFVVGKTLKISPEPKYTATRWIDYVGEVALDDGVFIGLTADQARVALLYSQYLVMTKSVSEQSRTGFRYQIGDEMIDKSSISRNLSSQANELLKAYHDGLRRYQSFGTTSKYHDLEAPPWLS